ncbi:MAG: hypothetical protein J6C88_07990 [Lachnospiraceae bacterium]|nr:hypothetical protein [Lachnospiraceae bacterium]
MAKKNKKRLWKTMVCFGLISGMMLGIGGCAGKSSGQNDTQQTSSAATEKQTVQKDGEDLLAKLQGKDQEIGMEGKCADQLSEDASEQEKLTVFYFDHDYMFVNSGEAIQRYIDIFEGAQVECYLSVAKILSYEGNDFEILAYLLENSDEVSNRYFEQDSRLVLIKGTTMDARFIQDDIILLRGRVNGLTSTNVDGVSLMVPEIIGTYGSVLGDSYYFYPPLLSYDEVKQMASGIFGSDILLQETSFEERVGSEFPSYTCTLKDQSNAKLSSYKFYDRLGTLTDKDHYNYDILVGADGEHFLLEMHNYDTNSLTIEYYDNTRTCLWSREFQNAGATYCDMTTKNLYMSMNNNLYIIDLENGEDVCEPQLVGEKMGIRKFDDGIFLLAADEADAFMYTDTEGNIKWKTDSDVRLHDVQSIQKVNDTIVVECQDASDVQANLDTESMSGACRVYYVLDAETGEVLHKGEVETPWFHNYG